MLSTLNWGVLSTARIARVVTIPAILGNMCHRWVSIYGRSEETVRSCITHFRDGYKTVPVDDEVSGYTSLEAFLSDPRAHAIYIASPNSLHCEYAIRALRAGKHVFCEKPLACNTKEAEALILEQRRAKRLVVENFSYHLSPGYKYLEQRLASGELGSVISLQIVFSYPATTTHNVRFYKELGGGCVLDLGCYGIDFAHRLLKSRLQVRETDTIVLPARGGQKNLGSGPKEPVEADFWGILLTQNGIEVSVRVSFTQARQQTVLVLCEEGIIFLNEPFNPRSKTTLLLETNKDCGKTISFPIVDQISLMLNEFSRRLTYQNSWYIDQERWLLNSEVLEKLVEVARRKIDYQRQPVAARLDDATSLVDQRNQGG